MGQIIITLNSIIPSVAMFSGLQVIVMFVGIVFFAMTYERMMSHPAALVLFFVQASGIFSLVYTLGKIPENPGNYQIESCYEESMKEDGLALIQSGVYPYEQGIETFKAMVNIKKLYNEPHELELSMIESFNKEIEKIKKTPMKSNRLYIIVKNDGKSNLAYELTENKYIYNYTVNNYAEWTGCSEKMLAKYSEIKTKF